MRRVIRRNADVRVESGDPKASREKLALYKRYLDTQHDSAMSRDYEAFVDFLYDSPMESREFCYRLGERLVGVSIADRCRHGYSSVYMYFDPDLAERSLGTFSAIWEIENCRREGLAYYYLGYYVAGSQTMSYKARFRPNQVLAGDDHWVSLQT